MLPRPYARAVLGQLQKSRRSDVNLPVKTSDGRTAIVGHWTLTATGQQCAANL